MMSGERSETVDGLHARGERTASVLLLVACVFWGLSFTWAKAAGESVNAATGGGPGSALGPVWVLGVRFLVASVVWLAVAPAAWRGWTRRGARRGSFLGALLAVAIVVQHLALDLSTEAITAFLTSLVVVFVPLLAWVVSRKRPKPIIWAGVGVATVGVWLMTGPASAGFGLGEILGLSCSVLWAVYVLAVGEIGPREHPARLVAAQFVVAGAIMLAWGAALGAGDPRGLIDATLHPQVWLNVVLLATFGTAVPYGILTYFQPKIDATRASLIYLGEPICAAIFAWLLVGRAMTGGQIAGAALILVANVVVEVLASRARVVAGD